MKRVCAGKDMPSVDKPCCSQSQCRKTTGTVAVKAQGANRSVLGAGVAKGHSAHWAGAVAQRPSAVLSGRALPVVGLPAGPSFHEALEGLRGAGPHPGLCGERLHRAAPVGVQRGGPLREAIPVVRGHVPWGRETR